MEHKGIGMIVYLSLFLPGLAFIVWRQYKEDVSQRKGIILGTILILLHIVFYFTKLPLVWCIFVDMITCLIVKI